MSSYSGQLCTVYLEAVGHISVLTWCLALAPLASVVGCDHYSWLYRKLACFVFSFWLNLFLVKLSTPPPDIYCASDHADVSKVSWSHINPSAVSSIQLVTSLSHLLFFLGGSYIFNAFPILTLVLIGF